jgi:hypothetical protein
MSELFSEKVCNIPTADSKDLAAHIVLYRVLGMDKEFAKLCMAELCARRDVGDNFDYENFIESEILKIPKPAPVNITSILSNIGSGIKKIKEATK